jgi:hypothetical protein
MKTRHLQIVDDFHKINLLSNGDDVSHNMERKLLLILGVFLTGASQENTWILRKPKTHQNKQTNTKHNTTSSNRYNTARRQRHLNTRGGREEEKPNKNLRTKPHP